MRFACLAFLFTCLAPVTRAGYTPANPPWNRPVEPFTVAGNLHYVGATSVSAFLITTPDGHILVDTGFRETVAQIESGIEKLGYQVADIRLLLITHAHFDHIGGMAEMKARTGARLLAHPAEFAALRAGGAGDFAYGDRFSFPPVTPDAPIADGESVTLGGTTLTAHHTPGHTRGNTSWSLTVRDGEVTREVLIAASLSAPDYILTGQGAYPGIMTDFATSFSKLRSLRCDILLASHGWDFGLPEKLVARATARVANPFLDPGELARFVDQAEANLLRQFDEQSAASPAPPPDHLRQPPGPGESAR